MAMLNSVKNPQFLKLIHPIHTKLSLPQKASTARSNEALKTPIAAKIAIIVPLVALAS